VPALPSGILEPLWVQVSALLPARQVHHPLGCHRPRIPDRIIFDKLIQILVFGCGYRRIADASCSATTLRRRRDEWISAGVAEQLRLAVLAAYDRLFGLELGHLAVDGCITKAPCGGQTAGPSPVDRRKQGLKTLDGHRSDWDPTGGASRPGHHRDDGLLEATLDAIGMVGMLPPSQSCTWMPATTTSPAERSWPSGGWSDRSQRGASRHRSRPAAGG
jgi:transposase